MAFRYAFDERKATQAAGLMISRAGGSLNYMKLIKLLYLANREAFRRWGRPIIPDGYFSLPKGPVLSNVLNLISEEPPPGTDSFWIKHISAPEAYKVHLIGDPGIDELSSIEIGILDKIVNRYREMDEWNLVDWCHRNLSEWTDPQSSCIEIPPEHILRAVGWDSVAIKRHLEEEEQYQIELQILQNA
jgi:uncharacterized phage-associated protein